MLPRRELSRLFRQSETTSIHKFLLKLLRDASQHAVPSVSGFHVGAIVHCEDSGNVYAGANLEISGATLGHTLHAEQAAVVTARAHGETRITHLAASAPPCGHCRQFLQELPSAADLKVLVPSADAGEHAVHLLGDLLPLSFSPGELGVPEHVHLLSQLRHGFRVPPAPAAPAGGSSGGVDLALVHAALEAADSSYVPYTGETSAAGVALRLPASGGDAGPVVSGSYMESCAYNPSIPPLQAALVSCSAALVTDDDDDDDGGAKQGNAGAGASDGGVPWADVEQLVLVHNADSGGGSADQRRRGRQATIVESVDHAASTIYLAGIALPRARVEVLDCEEAANILQTASAGGSG